MKENEKNSKHMLVMMDVPARNVVFIGTENGNAESSQIPLVSLRFTFEKLFI